MVRVKRFVMCVIVCLIISMGLTLGLEPADAIESSTSITIYMNKYDEWTLEIPPGMRLKRVEFPVNSYFSSGRPLGLQVDNTWYYDNYGQSESVIIPDTYGYTRFRIHHNVYSYDVKVQFTYVLEPTTAQEVTAQAALTAANTAATNAANAKTSADTASTRALNNYNILNNGTKGLYKTFDIANSAATNASGAKTSADNAKASADLAAARSLYNGQSSAYWAYVASQNTSNDTSPPEVTKIFGKNGATCTVSGFIDIEVEARDNTPGQLQARAAVDDGVYGTWMNIPQDTVPVTLLGVGAHTVTIQVKDLSGNTTTAKIIVFML